MLSAVTKLVTLLKVGGRLPARGPGTRGGDGRLPRLGSLLGDAPRPIPPLRSGEALLSEVVARHARPADLPRVGATASGGIVGACGIECPGALWQRAAGRMEAFPNARPRPGSTPPRTATTWATGGELVTMRLLGSTASPARSGSSRRNRHANTSRCGHHRSSAGCCQ